jgi:hypothetical protein
VARKVVLAVLTCIFVGGIAFFSLPGKYLPERIRPNPVIAGEFSGEPIEIVVPGSAPGMVQVSIKIEKGAGTCSVLHENRNGESIWAFTMKAGNWTGRAAAEGTLLIKAEKTGGGYRFEAGSPWSLFGLHMRLAGIACCIGGLTGMATRRSRVIVSLCRQLGARRICFAGVLACASGLVLYSTVHEFGHYIVGKMFGAQVDEVAWTVLSGAEPHVQFSSMPEGVGPWMSAAGPILPTLVAIVLISVWLIFAKRISWYTAACLLAPAIVFLIANLGCFFEMFDSGTHMNRLSAHLGLKGFVRIIFELLPLFVSIIMFAVAGWRIRGLVADKKAPQ